MKVHPWARCVDGPLEGRMVYRHGVDWKPRDFLEIAVPKEQQRLAIDRHWVTVFDVYVYQVQPPRDERFKGWRLFFVGVERAEE